MVRRHRHHQRQILDHFRFQPAKIAWPAEQGKVELALAHARLQFFRLAELDLDGVGAQGFLPSLL